ncbi:MAG: metalloregulator ArsR/SmtB family transcription factor [Isosphaeraceae bacterium]|nr:metalloregulator ArsR/SmtB family transcription factor [Isosphaeraceae bacterium]
MRAFKAGVFECLGHPARVAIVEFLGHGEMNVGQLCENLGLEESVVLEHLEMLQSRGLIRRRRDGRLLHYRLRDPRLIEILDRLRDLFFADLGRAMDSVSERVDQTRANRSAP